MYEIGQLPKVTLLKHICSKSAIHALMCPSQAVPRDQSCYFHTLLQTPEKPRSLVIAQMLENKK